MKNPEVIQILGTEWYACAERRNMLDCGDLLHVGNLLCRFQVGERGTGYFFDTTMSTCLPLGLKFNQRPSIK